MTKMKFLFAVLALTASVALVPAANAAPVVHFIGSGSSALYQASVVAVVNDVADQTLGIHHYTLKNNQKICTNGAVCSYLHDPRNAQIPNETTQLWIVWTCPTTGCTGNNATDVWAYGQVDSTVGVRTFLARATGCAAPCNTSATTFVVDPAVTSTVAGQDVVTPFLFQFGDHTGSANCPGSGAHTNTCDAALVPADVWQAVSGNLGQAITAGLTDIRAEDAKYATKRANKPLDTTTWNGLGYCTSGACNVGASIVSGVDGSTAATPVNFGLPGAADPLTGTVVPSTITTIPIGEAPILFLANRQDTQGLGAPDGAGGFYYSNLLSAAPATGVPTVFGIGKIFKSKDCEGNNAAFGTTGANVLPPGGTLMTISKVVVPGVFGAGTADYKFTITSGPLPTAGQRISFVFLSGGNNGTFTIGAVNGMGTVNKISVTNATAVNQATASGQALTNDFPVHLVIREPLSGTMNTAEYNAFRIYGGPQGSFTSGTRVPTNSQEQQVIVNNGIGDNPLKGAAINTGKPCIASFLTGANGTMGTGDKIRAVGTGQLVSYVKATQNSLGYAFFSFGNVASIATSTAYGYLTVDGVDPLFNSYSGGTTGQPGNGKLPFCDATGATSPSCLGFGVWGNIASIFPNLRDGSYRVWSLLRGLCDTANTHCLAASDPKGLQGIINAAQADIVNGTGVPDFLPFTQANQTRAHFQSGANFGAATGPLGNDSPEAGGDVGGCIIPAVVSAGTVDCHQ